MGLLKQEVKAKPDPWMNSVHFRARGLMNLQGQCCSVPLCLYVCVSSSVCMHGGGSAKGKEGVKVLDNYEN